MKRVARSILFWLIRLIGNIGRSPRTLHSLQSRQSPDGTLVSPRILLIHPGHLGNVLLATPALRAIKARIPEAHITMLVATWGQEVVTRHPDVDTILTCVFPSPREGTTEPVKSWLTLLSTAKALRRGHYDIALNLRPYFWWGSVLAWMAHIPLRVGHAGPSATPFLTTALPEEPRTHFTTGFLQVVSAGLQALGYPPLEEPMTPERYPSQFAPTRDENDWITTRLAEQGISPDTHLVIIHPGTGAALKMWGASSWSHCATQLYHTVTPAIPLRIVLTGAKHERSMLEEIARKAAVPTTIFITPTLGHLVALQQRAELVLGVDSGPLHLATAQGTPTVRIFGPTDALIFGPWGNEQQHTVITATQRCADCPSMPCGRLHIPAEQLASHPCTRLVPEQQVIAAALSHLGQLFASEQHTDKQSIIAQTDKQHTVVETGKQQSLPSMNYPQTDKQSIIQPIALSQRPARR